MALSLLNRMVDEVVLVYCAGVVAVIFFWFFRPKEEQRSMVYKNNINDESISSSANSNDINHTVGEDGEKFRSSWEMLQGRWRQVESENLDNFGLLSNQSKMRRTLGALAFYRVRHTITFQREEGNHSVETGGVRFFLLRDLGEGMQEWRVDARVGTSRDTAEVVEKAVDTPGAEKIYLYRLWIEESENGTDLMMESEPLEKDEDSIRTLQIRSLVDRNRMKMEWHGYNEVTGMSCGMVSFFDRILEKQ